MREEAAGTVRYLRPAWQDLALRGTTDAGAIATGGQTALAIDTRSRTNRRCPRPRTLAKARKPVGLPRCRSDESWSPRCWRKRPSRSPSQIGTRTAAAKQKARCRRSWRRWSRWRAAKRAADAFRRRLSRTHQARWWRGTSGINIERKACSIWAWRHKTPNVDFQHSSGPSPFCNGRLTKKMMANLLAIRTPPGDGADRALPLPQLKTGNAVGAVRRNRWAVPRYMRAVSKTTCMFARWLGSTAAGWVVITSR